MFWDTIKIEQLTKPESWKISRQGNDETAKEEVIFTIQGIIKAKDLPPVMAKPRSYRYKYLHQSITLTGLGSPTFSSALSAVKTIYDCFDRQFEEHTLDPWTESEVADGIPESIDLSNRYFTPATEAGGMKDTPFLPGIDPKGILQSMGQGDRTLSFVHTKDNQVHYFSTCRLNEGARKYENCEPQMFWAGDIVQAQVSFVAIPVKGGKCKLLSMLCSLALLEGQFASVSNFVHY
ncbi:hypothetical protein L208DRAFT_1250718 [Tricholoma matsutake]|nr:hypothetical protein L208DRAFT_1250718 [Tricholoma matsutake 945]